MTSKILLVDDEPDILTFIEDSLVMEGYEVRSALSGEEALKKLDNSVDLIILDVMLPDMNGKEKIHFTKKEYEVVKMLALHAGQVLTKEQLFEKIWGYDSESDVSTVVEHIKKIRTKLSVYDRENTYIQTVWGIGYKWSVQN
ncbi:response regulator transcription factor [Bacillus cereus]